MHADLVEINGGPGLVFSGGGRVIATVSFDIDADGRITAIHNVANPDKLRAVADGTAHHLAHAVSRPAHRQPVLVRSVVAASSVTTSRKRCSAGAVLPANHTISVYA